WYAMASVKWLAEIEVIDKPFTGHYQTDVYTYEWERKGQVVREPVTLQRVRSLITEPSANQEVEPGDLAIRGVAWSGVAPIARVEVSIANRPWQEARLVGERGRYSWQWWELITRLEAPSTTTIRARSWLVTASPGRQSGTGSVMATMQSRRCRCGSASRFPEGLLTNISDHHRNFCLNRDSN